MKKSKFDLQKTVNTLINTISSGSGHQLREKLCQIQGLLSGSTVTVGSKTVCAKSCPGGLEFCRDLFAKKLVVSFGIQVEFNIGINIGNSAFLCLLSILYLGSI